MTRQNRDDKTFIQNSIAAGDLTEKQLGATECFVEPCPNLRIESEFRKCKMIPIIHPYEWIDSHINDSGDTALLSQQVAHKDVILEVVNNDYMQFVSDTIDDEGKMERKVKEMIQSKG